MAPDPLDSAAEAAEESELTTPVARADEAPDAAEAPEDMALAAPMDAPSVAADASEEREEVTPLPITPPAPPEPPDAEDAEADMDAEPEGTSLKSRVGDQA